MLFLAGLATGVILTLIVEIVLFLAALRGE